MIPPPQLAPLPGTCVLKTKLRRGVLELENNDWGGGLAAPPHAMCIYLADAPGPGADLGWTWQYLTPSDQVMAYPEVVFGKKPWANYSTTHDLPRVLGPVPSLKVDYTIRTEATGRYNAAFEVWLTSTTGAHADNSADITHEVMWWIDQQGGPQPAGHLFERNLRFPDGRTCDLYIARPGQDWWPNPWVYFAFVFDAPATHGSLECGHYLHYLVQRGLLPSTRYITSLEFGNEIWTGEGFTVVDQYEVTLSPDLDVSGVPTGPTPVEPSEPEDPPEPPETEPRDATRAYIRLRVPAGAKVWVEGVATTSTARERIFMSPRLPDDGGEEREYVYRVKAQLPDGRIIERDVSVWRGYEVTEEFE